MTNALQHTYREIGVDYAALDEAKREALAAALSTRVTSRAQVLPESLGESATVFEVGGTTMATVLECLGTKTIAAREVHETLGLNRFDSVAYDTVAAIINDLCSVGALPLVVNAYFAAGDAAFFTRRERYTALVDGWRRACRDAGATWGGGESPALPDLIAGSDIELAGSAVGVVPEGRRPLFGEALSEGDEIVLVGSTGLHANGSSLARRAVRSLPDGYATRLRNGQSFGEALLEPSALYARLCEQLAIKRQPISYITHLTGHGLLKLMRARRELSYVVDRLPEAPVVLTAIAEALGMDDAEAYTTFNMGAGLAIYCRPGAGEAVVGLAHSCGWTAHIAGRVHAGARRVVLRQLGLVFDAQHLDLAPAERSGGESR